MIFKYKQYIICLYFLFHFFFGQNIFAKEPETIERAIERVIVVAPQFFNNSIQKWIKYRNSQGYNIILINPNETNSPQQIREQIITAATNCRVIAILIVGNAVVRCDSDRGRIIPSPRLPCRVINKIANDPHLASDDWYADFDKDNRANCPVGRFPVGDTESLDMLIQKTIRYETEIKPDLWCRQFQIVAGVGNFSPLVDPVIESAARYVFTKHLPSSYEISFLHANWRSPFCPSPLDIRNEYIATLNRAPMFWIYIGHGQHRALEPLATPQGKIKTLEDDSENQNNFPILNCENSLPVVMLLSCYGGTLDAKTKSTAEELLLQKNGAIAVVATSRTSMPYALAVFGTECLNEFLNRQNKPEKLLLGSIIFEAKKRMLKIVNDPETKNTEAKNIESKNAEAKTELNFENQKNFRHNLENIAKWFDPVPSKLDIQLEEHVEQIHFFGDPLLLTPKSIPITINTEPKIKAGEKLKIKGKINHEQIPIFRNDKYDFTGMNILIDISILPDRFSLRSIRREKNLTCNAATRQEDNDEYKLANQHVIARYIVPVAPNGIFETQIPTPKNLHGKYLIRTFCKLPKNYAIGSTIIFLQ
ncbi:MAG: C25 family cysteine peptidase [Planctomycetaceae bacterium]|nr:C25 family cysteine peptidase [Planctomycetaceae bacterium]